MFENLKEAKSNVFWGLGLDGARLRARVRVYSLEILYRKCRRWSFIEFGDFPKHVDGILVSALADQELGRLVEPENKTTNEKNDKSDHPDSYNFVAPAHVTGYRATAFTRTDTSGITCW